MVRIVALPGFCPSVEPGALPCWQARPAGALLDQPPGARFDLRLPIGTLVPLSVRNAQALRRAQRSTCRR